MRSTARNPRWPGIRSTPTSCGSATATAPTRLLLKDPSLLAPRRARIASYPGGHNEGFPDTFKQLVGKGVRLHSGGDYQAKPDFPTFADGHYEMQLCEAIERSAKEERWVEVE